MIEQAIQGIDRTVFEGKNVLVSGGLGFIGSNLAIALVELGANVIIVDAMIPEYGGNFFNIEPIADLVRVNLSDIRDENVMNYLVQGQDFIFHLAGQMDHILSLTNPYPDIDINIRGTAVVMEACKKYNPDIKVIYSGTRGQYGPGTNLPVSEDAPTNPKGLHEISRLTAEKIIKVYHETHGIQSTMFRITNTYGPRSQMRHSRYGVANWFVRLAIDGQTIKVFGNGQIIRDFLYIDDCIRALLMGATTPNAYGEIFNLATGIPTSFLELAQTLTNISSGGGWEFAPFSPERKAQEPGDFYADVNLIKQVIGWEPTTSLVSGIRETIDYYQKYKEHYWE